MMGNDSGKLIGVVENADPDFQMDSGYEIYGRSMLVASVSVDYESGGEVYDPWFADRGMDGSQDYTVPQGIYIEQGKKRSALSGEGGAAPIPFPAPGVCGGTLSGSL